MLSCEDEDEDRPLEPCVSQMTHVEAAPQVDDAVGIISGDSVNSTVIDAREVQAETMRRPTVRRLVLVPQSEKHTPQSIQDRFSQSSGTTELLEEAPDPHSGPSDVEGATLNSVNDTESLGDGQSDFDGEEESAAPEPEPIREADHAVTPAIREGLRSLDHFDLVHLFSIRAVEMKSPPKFVRGACRVAMRIALEEIGHQAQNEDRQSRGWKLCLVAEDALVPTTTRRSHPQTEGARQIR